MANKKSLRLLPEDEPPPDEEPQPARLVTAQIARALCTSQHFARDGGNALYYYDHGVYHPGGEDRIREAVKHYLQHEHRDAEWTSRKVYEVERYIGDDAPRLLSVPPPNTLNLANGLLDLSAGRLLRHDPDLRTTIQLPVLYDDSAACPAWVQFASEVLPGDCRNLLFEFCAWIMRPNRNIQQAGLFLGGGGNGKSTALAAIVAFLGKKNCTGLSLHRLERDRFSLARLVGKLANVCADIPTSHLESTVVFKAITGDDPVLTAEHKHTRSFEFECFCRLLFSANDLPRSSDASEGFFRRWFVVPFERQFVEGENAIPRDQLDARLHNPRELSGVLNRALDLLPSLSQTTTLTRTDSTSAAYLAFRRVTDPVGVWLDQNTVEDPDGAIPRSDLLALYNEDALKAGRHPLSKTAFGTTLHRLRPSADDKQRTIDGKLQWCYVGIGRRVLPEKGT